MNPESATSAAVSRATSPTPSSGGGANSRGGDGRLSVWVQMNNENDAYAALNGGAGRSASASKGMWSKPMKAHHRGSSSTPTISRNTSPPVPTKIASSALPQTAAPMPLAIQTLGKISLTSLSVEETIHLRTVYDQFALQEIGLVPTLNVCGASSVAATSDSNVQATVERPFDLFSVSALLHHCRIVPSLPPETELRRMILRVMMSNAQLVAKSTKADAVSASAVEAVLEIPSELTFSLFLEVCELVKRWSLRDSADEDEAAKAFTFLSRNRRHIRPIDEATIEAILGGKGLFNIAANTSVSSQAISQVISPATLDLEGIGSMYSNNANSTSQRPGDVMSLPGSGNSLAQQPLCTKHLQDLLKNVGAEYDFDTLFTSVDPHFDEHKGSKIDLKLFRWIAGSDDPDVIKAFVSLGGEEALSGTITVDKLIAKCEAMQMTPQYIANFITIVDPNQDGVVDYTEFLSLIVRNRQELSGERRSMLTDRGATTRSAFRFGDSSTDYAQNGRLGGQRGSTDVSDPSNASLPFPRQKRFSKADDPSRRTSIPYQIIDDEEAAAIAEADRFAFQEKLRSLFDAPDMLQLEGDDFLPFSPRESAPMTNEVESGSSSSDSEEGSKARQTRKRMSIQETHLGMGLSGMLQNRNGDKSKDKTPASIAERIEFAVKKGSDSISQHRVKVESALAELEKKQRKYIRTDDGLVEGNREHGESALKQRQRLRQQRIEGKKKLDDGPKPSPRVVVMSKKAVNQLQLEVDRMLSMQSEHAGHGGTTMSNSQSSTPRNVHVRSPDGTTEPVSSVKRIVSTPTPPSALSSNQHKTVHIVVEKRDEIPDSHTADVVQRLQGPHRSNRAMKLRCEHNAQRSVSIQAEFTPGSSAANVRPPSATAVQSRPSSQGGFSTTPRCVSREAAAAAPPVAVSRDTPTASSNVRKAKESPVVSRFAPHSTEYQRVRLEDPQSLWHLLEQNHRRMERERGDTAPAEVSKRSAQVELNGTGMDSRSTMRAFARTIASHLALRLPYDDEEIALGHGTAHANRTPSAIRQAYILNAPQPRPPHTAKHPQSHQQQQPHSRCATSSAAAASSIPAGGVAASSVSPLLPSAPVRTDGVVKPTRPQTAPTHRRPLSARTSRRQDQLSRVTNRSPIGTPIPTCNAVSSRPQSASRNNEVPQTTHMEKQFGVGGILDIDEDTFEDGDETVYV